MKDILIPSEERRYQMNPMDFEEFLWALGDDMLMPFIQQCFDKKMSLGGAMHRKAMDLFRQYMIVGGYTLTSLKKFCGKFSNQLSVPYVIHYQDLKEEEGIVYLPVYMVPML